MEDQGISDTEVGVAVRYLPRDPPRDFVVGREASITISDKGAIVLEPDELVTFLTESGTRYDLVKKDWGYYATPSLNDRLPSHRLKPALVCGSQSKYYILFVEDGLEEKFFQYLGDEDLRLVGWLDTVESITELFDAEKKVRHTDNSKMTCICSSTNFDVVFEYNNPPAGENSFKSTERKAQDDFYYREIYRCVSCGHFLSLHDMGLDELYSGDYVSTTYGDANGIRSAFEKINALPIDLSDNIGRVQWINLAYSRFSNDVNAGRLLDVGAGLGVFVFQMRRCGWDCVALEPDKELCSHIRETIDIETLSTNLSDSGIADKISETHGLFNLITFNKVLEHVQDPVSLLSCVGKLLSKNGGVYVELPDGESAHLEGKEREEFFVEHHHIFSATSISILAESAGFRVKLLERVHEPSSKYTLRAFCVRQ